MWHKICIIVVVLYQMKMTKYLNSFLNKVEIINIKFIYLNKNNILATEFIIYFY